jgi:hypothetical protein
VTQAKQQKPNQENEDEPRSALEFLKAISGAAGVLTALAFISGWLYWAIYYSAFGMNPLVMDFPVAVISVSPFWVLVRDAFTQEGGAATAGLVIVLMMCALLGSLFVYAYAHRRHYATVLLICMVILMTGGAVALGVHDARVDSGCHSRLADISFVFNAEPDPDAPPPPCQQMDCKLVIHLGNVYHYFPTPSCDPGSSAPVGHLLAMGEYFESEIKSVQTNRQGF